jgi:integrase/recombinase XerD
MPPSTGNHQLSAITLQALARHKNLNTTMRYIDLNENKLRAAVELVNY